MLRTPPGFIPLTLSHNKEFLLLCMDCSNKQLKFS